MADDLGWADVSYHGSEIRTPNIDRIAHEGIELDRFYVYPLCSSTRAALMTGQSAFRTGVTLPIGSFSEPGLPLDRTLLPERLQDAGYQTFMVGKWHLGGRSPDDFPHHRGFNHFYGHLGGFIDYYDHTVLGGIDWQRNGTTVREAGYSTELITDEAVALLRARDHDRPVFLFVSYNAPHGPQAAPRANIDRYAEIEDEERRVYAAMVDNMDVGIGRILETLEAEDMQNDTLVFFMSDNGGASTFPANFVPHSSEGRNEPLRGGKGLPLEGGIRVPAAAWWPGRIEGGVKSEEVIAVQDLLPTFAEAAGFSLPGKAELDGESRWGALRGRAPTSRGPFVVTALGGTAVIDGDWKLVRLSGIPLPFLLASTELYRFKEDPLEANDLSAEHPEVVARLESYLDSLDRVPPVGGERGPIGPLAAMRRRRAESSNAITQMPHAEKARLESVTVTGELRFNERSREFDGSTGTIVYDEGESFGGYTLFSPIGARASYLINMQGEVVHRWDLPEGMSVFKQVYLLDNGHLLRGVKPTERGLDKEGPGGTLQEVDWQGNVVWEYESPDRYTRLREDYVRLPNGHTIFMAFDEVTREEALALGATPERIGEGIETLWPNKVVEIDQAGHRVWEWRFWDHYGSEALGNQHDAGRVDINLIEAPIPSINRDMSHSSTVDYDPLHDHVLISARITSEIYVIDHGTANYADPKLGIEAARGPAGAILQRYGNPGNYGAGAPQRGADPGDRSFFAQHGPGWIPAGLSGSGHLLVHNNGVGRSRSPPSSRMGTAIFMLRRFLLSNTDDYSTVDEIDPTTGEVVWRFRADRPQAISGFVMGGAQRLPNGNTHITSGQHGHLFEVTPKGKVVWEYLSPASALGVQERPLPYPLHNIQNSHRLAADHPALRGRDLSAKGTVFENEPSPGIGARTGGVALRLAHGVLKTWVLGALAALLVGTAAWLIRGRLRRRTA
ncbi:MAG: sulfatase-like hydrolase/transferase [Deltaproteobacteria bacterium]|nr:sulfatase-like hydrolase/transferase [Deltaproteobacteria bacterium]